MTFEPSFLPSHTFIFELQLVENAIKIQRVVIAYNAIYFKSTSLGRLEFVHSQYIRTIVNKSMNGVLLWGRGLKTICCPYLDCYVKFFRKQQ